MTPDTARPVDGGHGHGHADLDLLAGLWEEARFARLPWDAPSELKELVEDIDNPKRVYAIHKASRRHNFQLLVQKYVVQLRDGCGSDTCSTATCFSCRKRIVGRAPIRRYNTTSARTLATYLASQDNPESGLCPTLRNPKAPPAATNSLAFVANSRDDRKGKANATRVVPPKGNVGGLQSHPVLARVEPGSGNAVLKVKTKVGESAETEKDQGNNQPRFLVSEQPSSKDYRSFAANVFGTVAFKMLEWLTPAAIDALSQRAKPFQDNSDDSRGGARGKSNEQRSPAPGTHDDGDSKKHEQTNRRVKDAKAKDTKEAKESSGGLQREAPSQSGLQRRNSNAKVRTSSGPKPKRQLSIDPFASDAVTDDPFGGLLRSPRANGAPPDRNTRGIKPASSSLSRPISQLSSAGYFDHVTLEKMPPPKPVEVKPKLGRTQLDGAIDNGFASPKEVSGTEASEPSSSSSSAQADEASDSDDESLYPQTLSRLNPDIVDFICDLVQEDGSAERHMLEPPTVSKFHTRFASQGKALKRKSRSGQPPSANLKMEWRLFVEQTLFYVMSDPQLVIRSFTMKGQLCDSQTLWYCMLRLTRIAPTLVFHSLWLAAARLFTPPKALQALRSRTTKLFPKDENDLSNAEAGRLMSICLHALVAAAPLVTDPRQLYDMSRIRAHGLSLAGSGAVAQQPTELCLQYDDAFTDDLALRLAKRLFAAITARNIFDEMKESNAVDDVEELDVLAPLFSQLDFLNLDAVYVLNFSFNDRTVHETRVPILLLDWARAVMLSDWDGNPEVPGSGPFGGALALIGAMYKKRQDLLLPDSQFRSEYFADRLDPVQIPVAWLSHDSTRQKLHLLDFPYIFSPSTLVSYFRSINFSRMSRSFEESTSLQERIEMIASRSSLSHHHKEVLTERLKTAAAKYLILDIKREGVLRDAFDQLWRREERELLRPLKVHLGETNGEEGFDSGGVQQEFFRMAIAEALNPKYGAFTVDDRTRMAWFVSGSMEPEWKFELVGLLVSLAVYNGLTLPVTFPKALYRKLLGEPVTELHHISDGWPDLASGLTALLEWDEKDGLVEDVFARTYEFSVSVFGQHVTREMKPADSSSSGSPADEWPQFPDLAWQGANTPAPQTGNPGEDEAPLVTNANRNAYVSDYIRYLTDISVRRQYEAFARGFRACLHPKSLTLLSPTLLQSVVEGVQEIDIAELKRCARYVGWDASHRTIKDFWSIVKRYDDSMKRKLLEFVTASDRVPVGGVKNLMFILQRNGSEDQPHGRLPTSYTCYGTLLLPEYSDKEMLKERLAMALENAQGFGFA
ncbi:hypothetical protein OQA88_9069 [Cercophora sp. LCS_1]